MPIVFKMSVWNDEGELMFCHEVSALVFASIFQMAFDSAKLVGLDAVLKVVNAK